MNERQSRLRSLLLKCSTMDMQSMMSGMGGRSMRSLYRDLSKLGYLSSFTHAGRYYTLAGIPNFDDLGLWFHQGVGFSRVGTLKETVATLVEGADAGRTHAELEALARVRVHNTLLGLVEEKRLSRERIGRLYLYASADEARRVGQFERRRALMSELGAGPDALPTEVVIAVLVEALLAGEGLAAGAVVAARLVAKGLDVTPEQVEHVFTEYLLAPGKKTVEPP